MAIAVIGRNKYHTEISTPSGHTLFADEPAEKEGTNTGPEPTEYVRMGLASCTAITLRMYADRKNLPLEKISVEVVSKKVDNKTVFARIITLEGNLTADQREHLLQIANACPVHKLLTNPIEISTSIV
jgi:putative redox protein